MESHVEETAGKHDKGFTLVELLIVIVILGILATITVFAVRGITDQGEKSACQASQKTYQVAIEAFYAAKGNAIAPTGPALVSAGLIRSYDPAGEVVVIKGTDGSATAVSTAGPLAGGRCAGVIVAA